MTKTKPADSAAAEEETEASSGLIDAGQGALYPGERQRSRRPLDGQILDDVHWLETFFLACNSLGSVLAVFGMCLFTFARMGQTTAEELLGYQAFGPLVVYLVLVHFVSDNLDIYWHSSSDTDDIERVVSLGPATWIWRWIPRTSLASITFLRQTYRIRDDHHGPGYPGTPVGAAWMVAPDGERTTLVPARIPASEVFEAARRWANQLGVPLKEDPEQDVGIVSRAPRHPAGDFAWLLAAATVFGWMTATHALLSRLSPNWWQA